MGFGLQMKLCSFKTSRKHEQLRNEFNDHLFKRCTSQVNVLRVILMKCTTSTRIIAIISLLSQDFCGNYMFVRSCLHDLTARSACLLVLSFIQSVRSHWPILIFQCSNAPPLSGLKFGKALYVVYKGL